jgi:hypothetical protein
VSVDVVPAEVAPGGTLHVTWAGIAGPTSNDHLRVCSLGAASDSACEVTAWWPTGGAGGGTLEIGLPAGLAPGWYDVRLLSPDAESYGVLKPIGRSEPILLVPEPRGATVAGAALLALAGLARRGR